MLHLSHPCAEPRTDRSSPLHFVRVDTFARRRCFADPGIAAQAVAALRALRQAHRPRVLAWVLLPDCWAGVVAPSPDAPLPQCVDALKNAMSRVLDPGAAPTNPVWSNGFHAHSLHDDTALAHAVETLLLEPIRAGLAQRRGEYRYWDAVWVNRSSESVLWEPL